MYFWEQSFHSVKYEEEVTIQYIESVVEIKKKYSPDVIVGIGGEKALTRQKVLRQKCRKGMGYTDRLHMQWIMECWNLQKGSRIYA